MYIPLMEDSFSDAERRAIQDCLAGGRYTQGERVTELEETFARWCGARCGIMVNSGSSANLLVVSVLKDLLGLKDGDEVLVPAVTWPTTVYPIIQNNLCPVFCDVGQDFNISGESMQRMVGERTRALFLVHLLGQAADMPAAERICRTHDLALLEDCCESAGATHAGRRVGTFGLMSTFSFYFGHHMTTIEGGMVLTDSEEAADLLRSARSHGWVRGSTRSKRYEDRFGCHAFLFDMMGYNLRSTELNAAIGLVQLERLAGFIEKRRENHRFFADQMADVDVRLQAVDSTQTSSFSFGLMTRSAELRDRCLRELPEEGIECRPIVAGNLLRQPVFAEKLRGKYRSDACPRADEIDVRGFYLPNNQFIDATKVSYMVDAVRRIVGTKS